MSKVTCPYCGKEFEVDWELFDYSDGFEDVTNQQECPQCGKYVNITRSIIIDYEAEECPCQMEDHQWVPYKTHPICFTRMHCIHCGLERQLTEKERFEHGIPTVDEYRKQLENFDN